MTSGQIKKLESSALDEASSDGSYLTYTTKLAGLDATALYFFTDDKLDKAGYFVQNSGANRYVQDYRTLTEYLNQKYGKAFFETLQLAEEKGIEQTDDQWNQWAAGDADTGFVAKWNAVDAEIMLVVKPNLHDLSDIQITYVKAGASF